MCTGHGKPSQSALYVCVQECGTLHGGWAARSQAGCTTSGRGFHGQSDVATLHQAPVHAQQAVQRLLSSTLERADYSEVLPPCSTVLVSELACPSQQRPKKRGLSTNDSWSEWQMACVRHAPGSGAFSCSSDGSGSLPLSLEGDSRERGPSLRAASVLPEQQLGHRFPKQSPGNAVPGQGQTVPETDMASLGLAGLHTTTNYKTGGTLQLRRARQASRTSCGFLKSTT